LKTKTRKHSRSRSFAIAIVGGGKVGSVLGRVLAEEGARIVAIVSRTTRSARAAGRFVGCANCSTELTAIPGETDVILIATPQAAISEVAEALANLGGLPLGRMAVCHTSGMLTAAALDPLAARGATVFSFHPLQTFPRDFSVCAILDSARGITFGVDGSARGLRMARYLARLLKGRTVLIPPALRSFYHAACVLASNHLTAMLAILESMHRTIRPEDKRFFTVYEPILRATLGNIAATSPAVALSGPIARGGIETVKGHFDALEAYAPDLIPYFTTMSRETARLASVKGSLTPLQREALEQLLRSYTEQPAQTKETT